MGTGSSILTIDRNHSNPADYGPSGHSEIFDIAYEESKSLALTSIDVSKIKIESIVDIDEEHPVDANEMIDRSVERIQQQGYIFLDAQVLRALFKNDHLIPSEWIRLADTDAMYTASIEFRGTVFRRRHDKSDLGIVGMMFVRGGWSWSQDDLKYSQQDLASFAKDNWGRIVRYAAVYPSN